MFNYLVQGVEIYAGVRRTRSGELMPTGIGRLCNWTPDPEGPGADDYPSFGAYQRSLTLVCDEGNPGVVTWIPDKNTPDTVYYQVPFNYKGVQLLLKKLSTAITFYFICDL